MGAGQFKQELGAIKKSALFRPQADEITIRQAEFPLQ